MRLTTEPSLQPHNFHAKIFFNKEIKSVNFFCREMWDSRQNENALHMTFHLIESKDCYFFFLFLLSVGLIGFGSWRLSQSLVCIFLLSCITRLRILRPSLTELYRLTWIYSVVHTGLKLEVLLRTHGVTKLHSWSKELTVVATLLSPCHCWGWDPRALTLSNQAVFNEGKSLVLL